MHPLRLLTACAALQLASCSLPSPPKLTPKKVTVTKVSTAGLELDVEFDAENPNRVELSARRVVAKVTLGDDYELGTSTFDEPLSLPAKETTSLTVPLVAKWRNLAALPAAIGTSKTVDFHVSGTVTIGGALSLDVPFTIDGTITRAKLVDVLRKSLPALPSLPGLPLGLP